MARKETGITFCGILYPDNVTHERAVSRLLEYYDFILVRHEPEEFEEPEVLKESKTEDNGKESTAEITVDTSGKAHYHFVIMFPYAYRKETLCRKLGLPDEDWRLIQKCSNRTSYVRYMTHYGDRSRKQYPKENFCTNRPVVLESDLKGIKIADEIRLEMLNRIEQNSYCVESDQPLTYLEFTKMLFSEGFSDEVRRFPQLVRDLYLSLYGRIYEVEG